MAARADDFALRDLGHEPLNRTRSAHEIGDGAVLVVADVIEVHADRRELALAVGARHGLELIYQASQERALTLRMLTRAALVRLRIAFVRASLASRLVRWVGISH